MELIDLQQQTTHGGSMRYTLGKIGKHQESSRVQEILAKEQIQGLDKTSTFVDFAGRVKESATSLRRIMEALKREGKTISAYGATSKSTTIYNYADIGPELIDYICDSTPIKQGKFSPGVHIPIFPEEHFRNSPPNYAFLAAWNHERELRSHNTSFSEIGGRWITHVPEVRIVD